MKYTYNYPRPAISVDAVIILYLKDKKMLLLIKRKNDPYKDKWALPGGFVDPGETLLDACKRELREETGLIDIDLIQFQAFDAIDRDPRERIISVVHYGFANPDRHYKVKGEDDAGEAKWFSLDALPELAFDHKDIVEKVIRKVCPESYQQGDENVSRI